MSQNEFVLAKKCLFFGKSVLLKSSPSEEAMKALLAVVFKERLLIFSGQWLPKINIMPGSELCLFYGLDTRQKKTF